MLHCKVSCSKVSIAGLGNSRLSFLSAATFSLPQNVCKHLALPQSVHPLIRALAIDLTDSAIHMQSICSKLLAILSETACRLTPVLTPRE